MTTQDQKTPVPQQEQEPHSRDDVRFPRIGDRKNPVRQGLLEFLLPSTEPVGSTVVDDKNEPWRRNAGFPPLWFGLMLAVVVLATVTDSLPDTMLGGFAITIILGGILIWFGNLFPYIREMGLPTILCTFGPATLVYFGLFPQHGLEVTPTSWLPKAS